MVIYFKTYMPLPKRPSTWIVILLAIVLIAITIWIYWTLSAVEKATQDKSPIAPTKPKPVPSVPVATPEKKEPAPLPPIVVHTAAPELSTQLVAADQSPQQKLQMVDQILYIYRQGFGENPVGQNEDIVASMLGENAKRTAFLPKDSPAIQNGKLVDEWGTPYWFHPISSKQMEIRSAGPDKQLFTEDDLTLDQ